MKLSIKQLASVVSSYVQANNVSYGSFVESRDNIVGLLDTIGKIFTITTNFVDKLDMLDGEDLSFGKTIEEWANDLILPEDYDSTGAGALSRHDLTYRPVYFAYTLGRKVIPLTIPNNNIERAVHNEGQFVSIINGMTKAMYDSETMLKYGIKRQLLGVVANLCLGLMDSSNADYTCTSASDGWATFSSGAVGAVNEVVYINITGGTYNGLYCIVRGIAAASTKTASELIAEGFLIKYDLVEELAKPVDTSTGEAFVKSVLAIEEVASDFSEGHSLNANTLGATPEEGLYLILKQGIMPSVKVDTWAGAFQKDDVALPIKIVVVPDLGGANAKVWGVLVDARGCKLHNTYRAVRENMNGDGDFLNMFFHTENTAFFSRNVFVRVYKTA